MKICTFLLAILFIITSCNEVANKMVVDEKTGNQMLVGITDRNAFELPDFSEWYNYEYTRYEPDKFIVKQIQKLSDSIDIQIFMGTWCSDSRREVPRFIKILDLSKFDQNKIQIINLNREKKSPGHEENDKNIEFIPTFIINKNNNEIGRIVEFPIITLESDLFIILLEAEL